MEHAREYSIPKAELDQVALEGYFDGTEVRAAISKNVEAALGAEMVQEGKGIFGVENFASKFTFDGSIQTKHDPKNAGPYGQFFGNGRQRRYAQKGDTYLLRGANYLVSIDPALDLNDKMNILEADFTAALDAVSLDGTGISADHFIEQSAVLDYAKNATVMLFNALVQEEKLGKFNLDNDAYQRMRVTAGQLARHTTHAYYAQLIGAEKHYADAITRTIERLEEFRSIGPYIEDGYLNGIHSMGNLSRPEAGHPLVIAASAFTNVRNIDPKPDTIIGLPSGGTEIAFAQQLAYDVLLQHPTHVVLVPLSLHSIKRAFGTDRMDMIGFRDFLERRGDFLRDKNLLIVEDNSSTGRTIQRLHDILGEIFESSSVQVAVAEADLVRSQIDRSASHRTNVASEKTYAHSVGVLPVSRKIKPKVDLKKIAERQRLVSAYRKDLEQAQTPAEQIMYRSFVHICERPTQEVLKSLDDTNAIQKFRHTFLSNFHPVPVQYGGKEYPTVEHAYQAQKFTSRAERDLPPIVLEEINDTLRARGHTVSVAHSDVFTDPGLSPGNVKVVADILRKHGYADEDWNQRRIVLMAELLLEKFKHPELAEMLLKTGDKYLVEGNTWNDVSWGVSGGRGRNLLGVMLMEIRDSLRRSRTSLAASTES
jgi:predicted NAD-dependent protein-ADP-ribosyltransferase YbiA (DUF1768 family)/hypoxanthine phosphoribosyltransferase